MNATIVVGLLTVGGILLIGIVMYLASVIDRQGQEIRKLRATKNSNKNRPL